MFKKLFSSWLVVGLTLCAVGCDVDQTREGELPNIDVDVSGDPGKLPAYDIEGPDVDVKMEERKVTVPDVDVDMEEKTIKTPNVDITLPKDE